MSLKLNSSGGGSVTLQEPTTASNRTLTLPDATGTVNTSGAVNEVPAGSASAPSIYPTGDTNTGIFFPAADTIAFAEGGVEAARFDSSGIFSCNLTQSAATNGYVKLPSGIYIQWGGANASTGGTTSNFPIAFPNTCWSLVAVNNNQTNPPAPSVSILSASQFRLTVNAGSPNCFYFAIGN